MMTLTIFKIANSRTEFFKRKAVLAGPKLSFAIKTLDVSSPQSVLFRESIMGILKHDFEILKVIVPFIFIFMMDYPQRRKYFYPSFGLQGRMAGIMLKQILFHEVSMFTNITASGAWMLRHVQQLVAMTIKPLSSLPGWSIFSAIPHWTLQQEASAGAVSSFSPTLFGPIIRFLERLTTNAANLFVGHKNKITPLYYNAHNYL